MANRPEPNGVVQAIAVEELFFSTTDQRGVIRAGNRVFVNTSRYGLDQLVGAPHNIVRHPEMPAGVFHLMWERLQEGLPMGGYVMNLAADGSTYWVYATITPMVDGYLSVRSVPCTPALAPVQELYKDLRAAELALTADGANRREVARQGALMVEERLRSYGFADYEEFMFVTLAEEVTTRDVLASRSHGRPEAVGPVAELLDTALTLDQALGDLAGSMDRYAELAEAIVPVSSELTANAEVLRSASAYAAEVSGRLANATLANVARVMGNPLDRTIDAQNRLRERLDDLGREVREVRFVIALARLHGEMVAAFAAEGIDGRAPVGSMSEVPLLCETLRIDLEIMVEGIDDVNGLLAATAEDLSLANRNYTEFGGLLTDWGRLAARQLPVDSVGEILTEIRTTMNKGRELAGRLETIGVQCRSARTEVNADRYDGIIAHMTSIVVDADVQPA